MQQLQADHHINTVKLLEVGSVKALWLGWIQIRAACRGYSRGGRQVHQEMSCWVLGCSDQSLIQSCDVLRGDRCLTSPGFFISYQPKCGTRKYLRQTDRGGWGLIVSVLYCTTVSTSINNVTKSNRYSPVVLTRGQQRFPGSVQYSLKNTGFNIETVCVDLTVSWENFTQKESAALSCWVL